MKIYNLVNFVLFDADHIDNFLFFCSLSRYYIRSIVFFFKLDVVCGDRFCCYSFFISWNWNVKLLIISTVICLLWERVIHVKTIYYTTNEQIKKKTEPDFFFSSWFFLFHGTKKNFLWFVISSLIWLTGGVTKLLDA